MKTLYQLKALGRSYRIQSRTPRCTSILFTYYYIDIYINHKWLRLVDVSFYSYNDALEYLICRISGDIRCAAQLSPLS